MKPIDADKLVFRYASNGAKYVTQRDIKEQPKFFPMCQNCIHYDYTGRTCCSVHSVWSYEHRDVDHICEEWIGNA